MRNGTGPEDGDGEREVVQPQCGNGLPNDYRSPVRIWWRLCIMHCKRDTVCYDNERGRAEREWWCKSIATGDMPHLILHNQPFDCCYALAPAYTHGAQHWQPIGTTVGALHRLGTCNTTIFSRSQVRSFVTVRLCIPLSLWRMGLQRNEMPSHLLYGASPAR